MGCCLSTNKSPSLSNPKHHHCSISTTFDTPLMEEDTETVKEVLSETPSLKPTAATAKLEEEVTKTDKESSLVLVSPEEVSQVSGICSASDNESMVSVLEKKVDRQEEEAGDDDDGEVRQMHMLNRSPAEFTRNRSYSGHSPLKRERGVRKSPVRRPDPLPARRNGGRGGSQISATTRRSGSSNNSSSHRSYSRENNGRRSKSPVKCSETGKCLSRSSSASGRVVTKAAAEKEQKVKETSETSKWPQSNESLENPMVSLECFIFL